MPFSKYSPKQKKLAALAGNKKKITKADLEKLRKRIKATDKKRGK